MEQLIPYLLGALVAVIAGLDRTAALQVMISRPLVVAPLTGLLLGDPRTGLTIGMFLELLWLCRLPVGASVPHDDTQVAVGATTLAVALSASHGGGIGLTLCSLLVALPLGKAGQGIERLVRLRNQRLPETAQRILAAGGIPPVERLHLTGLLHFALGALATYGIIVLAGGVLVRLIAPFFLGGLARQAHWIELALILVGVGSLLQSINVRRAWLLFSGGFAATLLLLWGLR